MSDIVRIGDIISFRAAGYRDVITGSVERIELEGNDMVYITKVEDNNSDIYFLVKDCNIVKDNIKKYFNKLEIIEG